MKVFLKRSLDTFGNIQLWWPLRKLTVFAVEEDDIERAQDLTRWCLNISITMIYKIRHC